MFMGLEESIQQDIEKVKGLNIGLNLFNGHPFVYQICEENKQINREQPAKGAMFPTFDPMAHFEGIYEIYIVGVWEGVPDEYKPILVIHELREHDTKSHKRAREYEMEFAKRFLGDKKFHEYVEWRKQYDQSFDSPEAHD